MQNARIAALERQLQQVEQYLGLDDATLSRVNAKVSNWSTAEQLDHVIKANSSVLYALDRAEKTDKPLHWIAKVLMFAGWIPRGKGKSPKSMVGVPAKCEELKQSLAKVRLQIAALPAEKAANPSPIVPHPRFGGLNGPQALRFAEMHTAHHLKIIKEILG